MIKDQARALKDCIDTLSEIALGGPSTDSLRADSMWGNEFEDEIIRMREKAMEQLKNMGIGCE